MISGFGGNSIDILMASYRRLEEEPIRKLEGRKSNINNRIGLFGDLKGKLSSLKSIVKELGYSGTTSIFGAKAATSSDESVATVTASSTAVATSHTLSVTQLAKADKVISNQLSLTGTDVAAGTHTFDITVNGTTKSVSVTIASGDDNQTALGKIVSAVNNTTGAGVKASVIKDSSTTNRLVFTSDKTGATFEMTLSDTSGTLLSGIGLSDSTASSGTSGGYVYATSALNATATVDGVSVQSDSNTLEDVIAGLTINLKKTQQAGDLAVTIKTENDVESIKGKLDGFIKAYNEVIDFIKTNTAVNTTTFQRSAFSGDFSVSNFRLQLRSKIGEAVTGLPVGDPTLLSSLGIETGRDGKLSITKSETLEDKIRDNLNQVEQIFNSTNGIASKLQTLVETMTGGEGILQKRRDVLQNQVKSINQRIDRKHTAVDKRLDYFREQFAQLQALTAQFSSQSNSIFTLTQSSFF